MRLNVIGRAADQAVIREFVEGESSPASASEIKGEAGIAKTTPWNAGIRSPDEGFAALPARPTAESDISGERSGKLGEFASVRRRNASVASAVMEAGRLIDPNTPMCSPHGLGTAVTAVGRDRRPAAITSDASSAAEVGS